MKSAIEELKSIEENRHGHLGYMNAQITHHNKRHICLRRDTHEILSFNAFVHKAISLKWDMILKLAFEIEEANYQRVKREAFREAVDILADSKP